MYVINAKKYDMSKLVKEASTEMKVFHMLQFFINDMGRGMSFLLKTYNIWRDLEQELFKVLFSFVLEQVATEHKFIKMFLEEAAGVFLKSYESQKLIYFLAVYENFLWKEKKLKQLLQNLKEFINKTTSFELEPVKLNSEQKNVLLELSNNLREKVNSISKKLVNIKQ